MDTTRAILDALRRAPDIVVPLVREVPPGILKRRPAPRRWSAHEHACHLAHVHALFFDRLEYMLKAPAPVIQPYLPGDQDADDLLMRMDLDVLGARRFGHALRSHTSIAITSNRRA